ncbi:hypothetical protein [Nostoc sp. FACHB-190]|uniref:hypothetical protein n=1 Tax=Nostoc sp. FACHB-190 TaxID=2692838 RepID=UPI001685AA94|nr:hypothetical protein [Nostoc sp. FACHB-190]MBD2303733.1 hypothetical protein [Nostoc sp. FACHB-190]
MSQSIHFGRIKYFSEEFTQDNQYGEILQELKYILEKEGNVDEMLDNKFTEGIETKTLSLNAYDDKIETFLKTGSEIQLHPESRYYFVNEKIWEVIAEAIFQKYKQLETKEDFSEIAEDYVTIKEFFQKKVLVFEVS